MILAEIKNYLMQRGQSSLADIAGHFNSDPEAIRGMLEVWLRKGKIIRHQASSSCSGCCKCDPAVMEIYQWMTD